jgi:hypothetical protein
VYKVFHFIKRKQHLTHEQFREHFERSHAAMALKFCGHLFSGYQRNYVNGALGGGDSRQEGSGYGPMAFEWDLISEWILPCEENLHEIYRIMNTPNIAHLFEEDEDRIIDRTATMTVPCTVFDVGVAFDAEGTVFDTPNGEPSWTGHETWTSTRTPPDKPATAT